MRKVSAYSRHSVFTGHSAQMRRARSTPTPSEGKNSAGLSDRQRPCSIQPRRVVIGPGEGVVHADLFNVGFGGAVPGFLRRRVCRTRLLQFPFTRGFSMASYRPPAQSQWPLRRSAPQAANLEPSGSGTIYGAHGVADCRTRPASQAPPPEPWSHTHVSESSVVSTWPPTPARPASSCGRRTEPRHASCSCP